MIRAFLLTQFLALSAYAGTTLESLREFLLARKAPVAAKASLNVTRWQRISAKEGSAGVDFSASTSGGTVSLSCASGVVNRPGGSEFDVARDIIDGTSLSRVAEWLNQAPELLDVLTRAELVEDKEATWKDQPARLLVFKLPPPKSDGEMSAKGTVSFKLWVDAKAAPLASEYSSELDAQILVVKVKNQHKVARTYASNETRVWVLDEAEDTESGAMGHQYASKQVVKVQAK